MFLDKVIGEILLKILKDNYSPFIIYLKLYEHVLLKL